MYLSSGMRKTLFSKTPSWLEGVRNTSSFSFQEKDAQLPFGRLLENIIGKMMPKGEHWILILEWARDIWTEVDCHGHLSRSPLSVSAFRWRVSSNLRTWQTKRLMCKPETADLALSVGRSRAIRGQSWMRRFLGWKIVYDHPWAHSNILPFQNDFACHWKIVQYARKWAKSPAPTSCYHGRDPCVNYGLADQPSGHRIHFWFVPYPSWWDCEISRGASFKFPHGHQPLLDQHCFKQPTKFDYLVTVFPTHIRWIPTPVHPVQEQFQESSWTSATSMVWTRHQPRHRYLKQRFWLPTSLPETFQLQVIGLSKFFGTCQRLECIWVRLPSHCHSSRFWIPSAEWNKFFYHCLWSEPEQHYLGFDLPSQDPQALLVEFPKFLHCRTTCFKQKWSTSLPWCTKVF